MNEEIKPIKGQKIFIILGIILIIAGIYLLNKSAVGSYFNALSFESGDSTFQNTQPSMQKQDLPSIKSVQKTSASILVTDQFNEPVENAEIWLEDERGKIYPDEYELTNGLVAWQTNKAGRKEFFYDPRGSVPSGNFTIHVERNKYSSIKETVVLSFTPTAVTISPDKFILKKWGKITALVLKESGEPPRGGVVSYWLTDSKGKEISMGDYSLAYTNDAGRLDTVSTPDGKYTLHIKCSRYNCVDNPENPNTTEWLAKNIEVEVSGSEVWLGKIILDKVKQ